jgi:hypothetical protein
LLDYGNEKSPYFRTSLDCIESFCGGAEGDRTPGLMTASHALSQLSYSPNISSIYKSKVLKLSMIISMTA